MYRRMLLTIIILLGMSALGFARPEMERRFLAQHGLTGEDIDTVERIYRQSLESGVAASMELQEIHNEISAILAEAQPDIERIRAQMRQALERELELRMNMLESEIAVRQIIGDEIWADIIRHRDRFEHRGRQSRRPLWQPRAFKDWSDKDGWLFRHR